ncbi:hypothetical protein ABXK61_16165 [Burkholderia sola]|uniref:hypothetical protein n=1 Tax=Burkholderia TaxID=32008 RepID=UPI001AE6B4BA|nr:hypothetical protein [Burkholderia sp. AcTa6-5]MBP0714841.1 hypothetical protein [Burkholderia sp. AcTa6-5]
MKTMNACMKAKITRRPWTPEETSLLIEIAEQRRVLRDEANRFVGRTYSALKSQSERMRLQIHRERGYTADEDRIVREIYASNSSIKSRLNSLPGRSYSSVKVRARQLGVAGSKPAATDGSLSVVRACVIALLAKHGPMATEDIVARLEYSLDSVRRTMRRGRGKDFYVIAWRRVGLHGLAPIWAIGCEPDAPRPPRKDTALCRREYKRRQKIAAAAFNPWVIRAAPDSVLTATAGRVFKQDMTIHSNDDVEVEA